MYHKPIVTDKKKLMELDSEVPRVLTLYNLCSLGFLNNKFLDGNIKLVIIVMVPINCVLRCQCQDCVICMLTMINFVFCLGLFTALMFILYLICDRSVIYKLDLF